jgi:hypothetical protein
MPTSDVNNLDFFYNDGSPLELLAGKVSASDFEFFTYNGIPFLSFTPIRFALADINNLEIYDANQEPFPAFYGNINSNIELFNVENEPFILWSPFTRPLAPAVNTTAVRRRIFLVG